MAGERGARNLASAPTHRALQPAPIVVAGPPQPRRHPRAHPPTAAVAPRRRAADAAPAAEGLEITFKGPDDKQVKLRLKMHTKMSKAFAAVSQKLGLEAQHKFLYEGIQVKNDDTPGDLNMESGAIITIAAHQDGGSRG